MLETTRARISILGPAVLWSTAGAAIKSASLTAWQIAGVTESRLGLHVVFGPYVTEWALQEGRSNVNRDRMEYVRANKGHRDRWRHLDLGSRLTEAGREPRTSTPSRSRDSPF